MARSKIVTEYAPPLVSDPTLTLDQKVQREIERNGITRPKGYNVTWHANPKVELHHFGQSHPMKPWRLTLTREITLAYGMHVAMDNYLSRPATLYEISEFHKEDYLHFLSTVKPDNMAEKKNTCEGPNFAAFNIGDDCPIFDGMYDYCSLYAGGSLDAARKLINHQSDIAINWSGGLHHAKKGEASGFCYVNDIVLAILQLLRHHPRVLYIDIDVHHGDGVEQAFYSTDRVLTLSFHRYDTPLEGENNGLGVFFPGTGAKHDTGPQNPSNPGAHHSLNVPLKEGIDDESYVSIFKEIVGPCIRNYHPTAVVLQCGADSLGCDRLGSLNLNIKAHGACVAFVKTFGLPLLILGGGGYTPRNVARLWAYETAICIGAADTINPRLPDHTPFLSHFEPDKTLFPPLSEGPKPKQNRNTREYLQELVQNIHEQLRYLQGAPSVQMQQIPPDILGIRDDIEEEIEAGRMELDEADEERHGAGAGISSRRKDKERGSGTRGELSE